MGPKEGGADPLAKAIIGRHRRDVAVMGLVLGESAEGGGYMFRRGIHFSGFERGMETATRLILEKVAAGKITRESAQTLLDAAARNAGAA